MYTKACANLEAEKTQPWSAQSSASSHALVPLRSLCFLCLYRRIFPNGLLSKHVTCRITVCVLFASLVMPWPLPSRQCMWRAKDPSETLSSAALSPSAWCVRVAGCASVLQPWCNYLETCQRKHCSFRAAVPELYPSVCSCVCVCLWLKWNTLGRPEPLTNT